MRSTVWHRVRTPIGVFVYVYPVLIVLAIYSAWLFSCLVLGRPPIPYRDYPDSISVDIASISAFLLLLFSPIAVPAGLFHAVFRPFGMVSRQSVLKIQLASVVVYVAMLFGCWAILFYDPWRISDWFFD